MRPLLLHAFSLILLFWSAAGSGFSAYGQNPKALFPGSYTPDTSLPEHSFRVAYLLPLAAKAALAQPNGTENKQLQPFLEFYEGAELALHYWRELGYSIETQLIDTKEPETVASSYSSVLEKSDVWIGPVYAEEFAPFASLARALQKTIVYPLSQMGEVWRNNPFVYQAAADNIELWKNMIDKAIFDEETADVLVFIQMNAWDEYAAYLPHILNQNDSLIYSPHSGQWRRIPQLKPLLQDRLHRNINVRLVAYEAGQNPTISRNHLARILHSDHKHKFIILSQDEAFLSDLLENLTALGSDGKYGIQVYGMPRWNRLESLNSSWFYELNTHIPSAYYANYETPLAQRFVKDFMHKHAMDPSPFAIQGFDLTNHFIQRQLNLPSPLFPALQSRYRFERIEGGGYRNTAGFILEYTHAYELIAH